MPGSCSLDYKGIASSRPVIPAGTRPKTRTVDRARTRQDLAGAPCANFYRTSLVEVLVVAFKMLAMHVRSPCRVCTGMVGTDIVPHCWYPVVPFEWCKLHSLVCLGDFSCKLVKHCVSTWFIPVHPTAQVVALRLFLGSFSGP